jgi:hypothetical protein
MSSLDGVNIDFPSLPIRIHTTAESFNKGVLFSDELGQQLMRAWLVDQMLPLVLTIINDRSSSMRLREHDKNGNQWLM